MSNKEQWIASTFVEIADHLVGDFDVIDLLSTLAERCAEFVDASDVGFMLVDPAGSLQVVSASSEKMEALELFELQGSQGPCLDSFRSGEPVLNQDVDQILQKWPSFGPQVVAAGISTVHAIPMRLRSETIGAVNIFHTEPHTLSGTEAAITRAFADAASIVIIQERALRNATRLGEQLQFALEARIVIEQAKGVLSERLQLDMGSTFAVLRKYSRDNSRRLGDVARDITEGRLPPALFRNVNDNSNH